MYNRRSMTRVLSVPAASVGRDVHLTLEDILEEQVAGRCLPEGYVRPKSVRLESASMGKLLTSGAVAYEVHYVADVLFPREGQEFACTVASINKMGIVAGIDNDGRETPVKLIVPRDLYVDDPYYQSIRPGDAINVRIVAQDFHYGSTTIIVIAELVPPVVAVPDEAAPMETAEDADAGGRSISLESLVSKHGRRDAQASDIFQ